MNASTTTFAAIVACVSLACDAGMGEGNPFAGASWIGENGEKETAWRYEEAKRCRGVSGKKVRVWGEISNPLPKHCPRFRKTFSLGPGPIAKAQVFVTGLGFYELWVNGRKADPLRVLAPGVTSQERVLADKYDVARLLRPGEKNTIGIWLAPGYSDDFSRFSKWVWMAPKRAILKLDVEYADGGRTSVATDGTWETTPESPILYASIYHGEVYDAAREDNAWATPNGKADGWRAATVFPDGPQTLFFDAPPVRMSDPRPPEKIVETAPGVFTVDFGQNRAGFVAIRAKGPKGTRIRVKTSELLGADGKIDPWTNSGAKSTDEFVLAGTGDVEEYVPRFTYHGFRYAEITGWPGRPKKEDLAAWAVHADVKGASSFRCSDETLMKLYNAARWSMLSNFMSYPSDCCMRDERTPCLMDSQAYEDAACEFFDMRGYYGRWLDDIRHVRGGAPSWTGDAATLPFRLWRYYGDARALERDLETVAAYVDAQMKGHPDYIFTDGHGDWCAPNAGTWKSYFNDGELVSSAIFCSILGQAAEGFKYLGKDKEARDFTARFEAAKSSFNRKFYDKATHTYGDGSQATAVLPLAFGLVPDGERAAVAAQLVARIRGKDGGKIDTGIFGTRYIGEVLCDLGECDLLLDMYTRPEYPGFGYMFDNGATTLWEQWSFKGGMNSHNHAMMSGGAVWLFTRLAGIRPAKPGYSEVLVKPCYPKGISFAEASRVTPHGEIKVRWDRGADGDVTVRVSIPDGVSSAMFEFPDGRRRELPKGASCIKVAADDVLFVRSSTLSFGFDARDGRLVKVVAADGTDLSPKVAADIFTIKQLTRTDDFSVSESISPQAAAIFRHEPIADGLRLVWEDLGGKLSRVECTVRGSATDRKVRFGLALWPTNGWAVAVASYPCINFSGRIGESIEDDRLLSGSKEHPMPDNIASQPVERGFFYPQQPGPLAVQTAFWWDPSLLVYTAAEDDKGDVKCVGAIRTKSGDMRLWWDRRCFDQAPVRLDYDFVFAAVCGTKDNPVTWHDGADIYRDWARTKTRLCPVPAWKRPDVPACLADAAAVTLFNRTWFDDVSKTRRWVDECWSRVAPGAPLVAILWGWENYGTWVNPHSFPCNPSDEAFVSLVRDLAAKNIHAFPWPSGYNWTLSYGTNEAGVVQHDWREDFRRRAAPHACITCDGKVVERAAYWLHGGAYAKMCGGDDWTVRWFADDVASELAKRGCTMISVDQNKGGRFDPCWSRSHPHTPGEGRWKTVAARRLLEEVSNAVRKEHGKSAVTYEDPNEQFNDLSSLQLMRDVKLKGEWASVYNYVYHEYMPVFQAEPRSRGDLVWMAYSAAEGQMPRIVPYMYDLEPGGGGGWYFDYMKSWISIFRGEGRPFLAYGRRIKPPQVVCGTITRPDGCSSPAVFVAAYESDKGERAVVLANATHDAQDVQVLFKNSKVALTLAPREIRISQFENHICAN